MESKLVQSVVDYCVKKLNAIDDGLGDLLKEAVAPQPIMAPSVFKLDQDNVKKITDTLDKKSKTLSKPKDRVKRSKFAHKNWEDYVIAVYERMREAGKDYQACLIQLSVSMRRRGDGPAGLPELRKFLQNKGYDIPESRIKNTKAPVLPKNDEPTEVTPSADELQLTGSPGWVRSEIIRLAALLNSPERIADMLKEWIDADSIVRVLEEDKARVMTAIGFKDKKMRQHYINDLAVHFNKVLEGKR